MSALAQRRVVLAVILFILFARDGDAAEKKPGKPAPQQLGRDQKDAARHNLAINKSVHRAVAMQADIQRPARPRAGAPDATP